MLSIKDLFQKLFTLPTGLYVAILVGLLVGGGSAGRYISYRTKRTLEAVGFQYPRALTTWLVLGNIFVGAGLLLFVGMLLGNIALKGFRLDSWTVLFVAVSVLVSLVFVIPIVTVAKKLENARNRQSSFTGPPSQNMP